MPDESYYQERGEQRNWPKIILIVLGAIILALLAFLLIKGCGKTNGTNGDLEKDLLQAGKQYYLVDETLLPQATGECKMVTLDTLITDELITTPDNYADCNKEKTYVKVCKLESQRYQYVPVMQCGNKLADDQFDDWKEGTESDLVVDKSDVRFTFKGEYLKVADENLGEQKEAWLDELKGSNYTTVSSTKYYRYRDLTWKWQTSSKEYYGTSAYYLNSPADGYTNAEGKTTGWKWYTETAGNKVWEKVGEPTVTKASVFQYACTDKTYTALVKSNIKCSERTDSATIELAYTVTCDGKTPLAEGDINTVCSVTCKTGLLNDAKTECGNMVTKTVKKYYPSNSTDSSKENTYYLTAPIEGAKKDESTSAQVSRFYKLNTTVSGYLSSAPSSDAVKVGDGVWSNWTEYQTTQPKAYAGTRQIETRTKVIYKLITNNTNIDNWVAISDEYLSATDLINKFKSLEYDVKTLEDIEKAEDLRYQVKLEYRNRK